MNRFKYIEKNNFGYYTIYNLKDGILGYTYSEIHENHEIIYGFFVEEKYRNRKVGTELLKKYLELKTNKDIFLHVQFNNTNAIKLYERFKFVITEETPISNNYKPKYQDVYCMKLNKIV